MREAGAWMLQPGDRMSQIGDTHHKRVRDPGPAPGPGMRFLPRSGWAMVKAGESHLITSAAHVTRAHKHADELSFELCERGERVIADTGKFSYGEDHWLRGYVLSARAHSTLVVDGQDGA